MEGHDEKFRIGQKGLDACTAAQVTHFLQGNSTTCNDIFAADHIAQCFTRLNQPIDTDRVVGHLVIDVCIECGRRRAGRQQLLLVELEQCESDLEQECASTSATRGKIFGNLGGLVIAILSTRDI